MQRAICRLAEGAEPSAVRRAIEQACAVDYEIPTDCARRRPSVCFWRWALTSVPERFEALQPWLEED